MPQSINEDSNYDDIVEMNVDDHQSIGEESKCQVVVEGEKLFEVCVENETITTFLEESENNVETKKRDKEKKDNAIKSGWEKQYSCEEQLWEWGYWSY